MSSTSASRRDVGPRGAGRVGRGITTVRGAISALAAVGVIVLPALALSALPSAAATSTTTTTTPSTTTTTTPSTTTTTTPSTTTTTTPTGSGRTPSTSSTTTTTTTPTGSGASTSTAPKSSASSTVSAYWLVASDGGIFSFGGAPFYGSMGGIPLNKPIVGMAATPTGKGYWEVASDGGIFSFGAAQFYGSMGGIPLNKPVVGMAADPSGGYWEVASDGGIFAFGGAQFYGSMGGKWLYRPIVGIAATPTGKGYWEVASDGGIFAFGAAQFYGSTGGMTLNAPIVGMTPTPSGHGYWFTTAEGGVFAFGSAGFYGSLGSEPQSRPVVAITADAKGNGYWFANDNGAASAFGTATYWGSAPQVLDAPVVGMAEATGTGEFSPSTFPPGSTGYDISDWQCGKLPPSPHTIGVVQVNGASFASTNPCLATEAAWAGGGLNLYTFLTFGATPSSADAGCASLATPDACNYGYNAALYAFGEARAAGVNTSVPWWLDVEGKTLYWSNSTAANASLVQGAIDGLHYAGINSVGVYASPADWGAIVGTYQPAIPYWMAWWTGTGGYSCANAGQIAAQYTVPAGPVVITQFTDDSGTLGFDGDYAC